MSAGIIGFGRLWPVAAGSPEDEATPVGLAPGQMPVDPRRDGMIQPTAAGRQLSGALGNAAGGMAQGLLDAAKLPGDVYAGRVDPMSDEGIQRANDLAGFAMTGGIAAPAKAAGEAALGSGPIRAYHGSPHNFDRFDISKLGGGEGAQAYGHGLYFAENEGVARSYRDALSPRSYTADGKSITDPTGIDIARQAMDYQIPVVAYIANRNHDLSNIFADFPHLPEAAALRQQVERARELQGAKLGSKTGGHMYEVAIDADPKAFLAYDRPLSDQGLSYLQDFVRSPDNGLTGGGLLRILERDYGRAGAAQALDQAGIPGVRYLDGMSRGSGDGSHNIVTFGDDIVSILRKYGLAGGIGAGATAAALSPDDAAAAPIRPFGALPR